MSSWLFAFFCLCFQALRNKDSKEIKIHRTLVIAHRGNTSSHMENTRPAIESAFMLGCDGVEFDVQMTKDKVPIIFHDNSLKRLCGINKQVSEVTLSELKTLKISSSHYTQSYDIPTLEEMLAIIPDNKLVNTEIKASSLLRKKGNIIKVLSLINLHRERLFIVISSFDLEIIAMIARLKAPYALGILLQKNLTGSELLKILPYARFLSYLNPHLSLLNQKNTLLLKKQKIPIIAWGHKKKGSEKNVTSFKHYALISDIPSYLIESLENP